MALLHSAPSVLKTASPFTARVHRSTALVPSGRPARSVTSQNIILCHLRYQEAAERITDEALSFKL